MDPDSDPDLVLSTVLALADSLRDQSAVSVHDLLDAYATFAVRIRSLSPLLLARDAPLPALAFLKLHKDSFVQALRRDVRLAHIDPLSPSEPSLNLGIVPTQRARDSSSLCHHALCALTTILRFPALHALFSEHDLSMLFGDVLDIALADHLPVLNHAKAYSLSLWSLSCHRLPQAVLTSRRDDVVSALQRSLDTASQPANVVLDGIMAISHTVECHPSAFLHLLSPVLPDLITNIRCESSEFRFRASIALGKFADALISHPQLAWTQWKTLSDPVISFLESHCDEFQLAPGYTSLSHILRAPLTAESSPRPRDAPTWVLAVLASLIVLCGPALYKNPTVLRFIVQSLATALKHKRSVIRALHPHVWKCFVWTFGQMLLGPESVDPTAFYVVKQEVGGGIGIALTVILLSDRISATWFDRRADRVAQALSVVEAMVLTQCKHTRREGFMFLQAIAADTQVRHQITQNMHQIPASVLLNGAIIGAEWNSLPSIIRSIPTIPVSVHWLGETEIVGHCKTLLNIWKHFAINVDKKERDPSLVDVWLSLLLTCSRQFECGQQVVATTEVLRFAALTITEFLPPVPLSECQPDWGSWNVHDQLCRLTFIDQLWSTVRRVFVAPSLAEAAELILTSILKYAFHVLDLGVQTLWGRLCASLMVTAPPLFLHDAHDRTASQLIIRSRRELWGVVATSLSSPELGPEGGDLVKFLAIPVGCWALSGPELEVWEVLLRGAITMSGDSAIVTEILQYLQGKEAENWQSLIPVLGFLLASTHEHGSFPTDELLSMLDVCLTVSYSRACHSLEALTRSLGLLNIVCRVIVSASDKVMRILRVLCGSLCLWIEDRAEVMSDEEFNSVAVSLYCETLKILENLPLSTQSLQDMASFLASAFSRIPKPAAAPFAFEIFWRATYHGRSEFCNTLPLEIKSCLGCFVAAYGGDLANGLSLTTESQSQSINDGSQSRFQINHRHQDSSVFDMETVPHGHQMPTGQEDVTFLTPSIDDNALRQTDMGQCQEHSSRMDTSAQGGLERPTRNPRAYLSSTLSPGGVMPSSRSPQENHSIPVRMPDQKRKLADHDDVPRKRSRTSRSTLRAIRKLESEPASRDVTPIGVPRMNSVPLNNRMVFDGVHVPTLRTITQRRKIVQRAEPCADTIGTEQGHASAPQTPLSHSSQRSKTSPSSLPPSVGSGEERFDWEDLRVDATPSEVDIDQSLVDDDPCSPLWTRACTPHEFDAGPHPASGSSLPKAMSQNAIPSLAPPRPSLERAKTTSTRLDALRDVYSSVENAASQIPMSELLQATRLVHQIGAVLTEQMGKKMGDR